VGGFDEPLARQPLPLAWSEVGIMNTFTIAAAQSSSVKGDIPENIRRHAELVVLAREQGADAVVFPELSLTGYEPTVAALTAIDAHDSVLRPLQTLVDDLAVIVMAGCPIRSSHPRPYIGMLILRPGGSTAVYRKRFVHSSEEPHFVASDDSVVFVAGGTTIGVAICADISNPIHPADAARQGAKLYVAGVAKTPDEIGAAEANMAAYAKQHAMMTIMANYASPTGGFPTGGRSAAWDESGRLMARAQSHGECLVLACRAATGWTGRVVNP
jgi:predicted amidohydrolase